MPKTSPMLKKMKDEMEAKYRAAFHAKLDMLLQMGQDCAIIAANEILNMGAGRAPQFCKCYTETLNEMALLIDQDDDPEFLWAKSKIDGRIRAIVGEENFAPWELRYHGTK